MLRVDATIRLALGNYEACIAPAAGARLTSLVWHGRPAPLECVMPWHHVGDFDAHQWPKAGAFPMLPFTNRLRNARFDWGSQTVQLTPQQDQPHGLHGVGHRRSWEVVQASSDVLTLSLTHQEPDADWPWSFAAEVRYALTPDGLQVSISLQNTSPADMPAALGWHPFVPLAAPEPGQSGYVKLMARQSHAMSADGLARAPLSSANAPVHKFLAPTFTPQTTAYEGWDGQFLLEVDSKHSLCVSSSDAAHLVVHVPAKPGYLCIEPITALPGALENYSSAQKQRHLALAPGATRRMTCCLGLVANPR